MATRTARSRVLFAGLTILLTFSLSHAYRLWWPDDGVAVRQGQHIEFYRTTRSIATNEEYQTLIVWSDTRTSSRDVYAQLYDDQGQPLWEEEGVLVARANGRQESPVVLAASDGTWIVVWEDYRNDVEIHDKCDLFAQKLDDNGEIQWPEGSPDYAGVTVVELTESREVSPAVFDDGSGGATIIWVSDRSDYGDLFSMHLLNDGAPDPNWNENGNLFAGGDGEQANYQGYGFTAVTDGAGGIVAGWIDTRDPEDANLYMNRMNVDGELMWADSSGLALCTVPGDQSNPRVIGDGLGGCFFGWLSEGSYNGRANIWMQHVQEDGAVDWGENGDSLIYNDIDFFQSHARSELRLVNTVPGEVMLVWRDKNTLNEDESYDLRMQKVSLNDDDQPVLHWAEDDTLNLGIVLCDASGEQRSPYVSPDGEGGMIVVWNMIEIPLPHHLYEQNRSYIQRVNPEGERLWADPDGLPLCESIPTQGLPTVCVAGENAFAFWFDYRFSTAIYRQLVALSTGNYLLDSEGEAVYEGIGGNAKQPYIVYDPAFEDDVWIGWFDGRFGPWGYHPMIQKCDVENGGPLLESNGVSMIPGFPFTADGDSIPLRYVDSLRMIPDGEGGVFAAWQDSRTLYSSNVALQHIASDGSVLWGDEGVAFINIDYRSSFHPLLQQRDEGGVFVAFGEYNDDFILNIRLAAIMEQGDFFWEGEDGAGRIWITNDNDHDHNLQAFTRFADWQVDPPNEAPLILIDQVQLGQGSCNLLAHAYSLTGDSLWTATICNDSSNKRNIHATPLDDGMLIVWEDRRLGEHDWQIYGQLVRLDGSLAWEEWGRLLVDNASSQLDLQLSSSSFTEFWLTWCEEQESHLQAIYAQRFGNDGLPLLQPSSGIEVVSPGVDVKTPHIVGDSQGGVTIAWSWADGEQIHYINNLYCTHLDQYGNPVDDLPDQGGFPLTQAYHNQDHVQLISDSADGALAVWRDYRSTGKEFESDIYAQRLDGPGTWGTRERQPTQPGEWALDAAYPNPFNPATQIGFSLPQRMDVTLTVYDVLGREVIRLVDGSLAAGRHSVMWKGTDAGGRMVASGTYFYRLQEADRRALVQKMVLVK